MEGFRYRNDLNSTLKPDFFKGFPPAAVVERNLVWDTGMIEMYGQNYFDHLKLNEAYHATSHEDVVMPDVGTFHSRDVVLEWVGRSQRNGQDCALIRYQSFFNLPEFASGGITLKRLQRLLEVVVGEMKLPGENATKVVNVFRIGAFEPVSVK